MHPIRGTSRSAECRLRNPALDPSRQADWFLRLDGIPPICPDSVPNGEFYTSNSGHTCPQYKNTMKA